jgi:hypothetical protein
MFSVTVAALRLTLRFVVGVIAWLAGAYLGYKLVRSRSRE